MDVLTGPGRTTAPAAGTPPAAAAVQLRGDGLTIPDIARVGAGAAVGVTTDQRVLDQVHASRAVTAKLADEGTPVYGVTTLFGGMADRTVPREAVALLQRNLVLSHRTGAGDRLPAADVRAAMLLRANSLLRGVSGVRLEIIERLALFLNAGVTPHVPELGSIGASGDLVPLAYIAGSISGMAHGFKVDMGSETLDATEALSRLGVEPLPLQAKEGLGLMNGTSVMTGIAANCVHRARVLMAGSLGAHALFLQGLHATNQSFQPFIHRHKPHPGQLWTAEHTRALLEGSALIRDEGAGHRDSRGGDLIQDRYSMRCLPQFLGPIIDGLAQISRSVEIEANSATDNPLIDAEHGAVYQLRQFPGPVHRRGHGPAALADRADGQAPGRTDRAPRGAGVQPRPVSVARGQYRQPGQCRSEAAAADRQFDHAAARVLRLVARRPVSDPRGAVQPEHQQPGIRIRQPDTQVAGHLRLVHSRCAAVRRAGGRSAHPPRRRPL